MTLQCTTCGAAEPAQNTWCSNAFHAPYVYSAAVLRGEMDDLRDLLSSIWLYTNWKNVTMHLTTEQREMWLAIIVAGSEAGIDPKDWRWWE